MVECSAAEIDSAAVAPDEQVKERVVRDAAAIASYALEGESSTVEVVSAIAELADDHAGGDDGRRARLGHDAARLVGAALRPPRVSEGRDVDLAAVIDGGIAADGKGGITSRAHEQFIARKDASRHRYGPTRPVLQRQRVKVATFDLAAGHVDHAVAVVADEEEVEAAGVGGGNVDRAGVHVKCASGTGVDTDSEKFERGERAAVVIPDAGRTRCDADIDRRDERAGGKAAGREEVDRATQSLVRGTQ